jgi:hypothetical protein
MWEYPGRSARGPNSAFDLRDAPGMPTYTHRERYQCPAMTRYDGLIAECAKCAGHHGMHQDMAGVRWTDEVSTY